MWCLPDYNRSVPDYTVHSDLRAAVGTVEEITNDPGNGNLVLRVRPFTNGEDVGEVMVLTDFSTKIVDASPTESNS